MYLVVLENEESLNECEQQMHDVNEDEDFAFACFCRNGFKISSDVESIQSNATKGEG